MNSTARDMATVLENAGVGTFGTDIFMSKEPDDDTMAQTVPIITLYDSGGEAPNPRPRYRYDRPTMQVRVRGVKGGYAAAYAKALEVRAALEVVFNQVVGGTRYVGVWATGDILPIGYDDKNRPLLSINYRIHRTPGT